MFDCAILPDQDTQKNDERILVFSGNKTTAIRFWW